MDADRDVVLLGDGQRGVHDGRGTGRVLVDLEAAGAHLEVALDGGRVGGAAPPEQLDVERERLPRFEQAMEVVGRVDAEVGDVAVAHPDDVVVPAESAAGIRLVVARWTWHRRCRAWRSCPRP